MAYQGGNLKSTSVNGVKIYTVIGQQRSTATWLPPKKQRALRKNNDYLQRVELIQDLKFETATTKIKVSPDGEFFIASGIYPPQMKVYELKELSLKFERHLVSEIVDFQILSDDYSKLAFLCADRSIRLHAKYGSHYSLRIPRMGRDIDYDSWSCDLLCAASSPDLYRINLEQGRFLSSLNTQSPALNVVSRSKLHGLVACGGDDGAVECFDMRVRSSVGRINAAAAAGDGDQGVTAVEFDGDGGYHMAVGSSAGKVMIYDLRSSYPLRIKDHMYGSPILDIKWHHSINSEQAKLVTTDRHIVRIWDPDTGEGMTSIEPTGGGINDICVFKDSGLILLALDSSQIPSYFIPALGPAPKWCSYLENLTEEMEEGAEITIYDNFKFLTKEDLERLNLTNLIGTNLLRAHMHGYFIDHQLYKKAKSLSEPFAFEAYLEQQKKERLEEERASRITPKRKLPKVNTSLVEKILHEEENEKKDVDVDVDGRRKPSKKRKGLTLKDISEPRFKPLTENKDYEIDETSFEFKALHPIASQKQPPKSLVDEHFEPVTDDEEDENSSDSDASDRDPSSRVPRLHEIKDERHADAFGNRRSLANEDSLPIGERVAALNQDKKRGYGGSNDVKIGLGGSREISFRAKRSSRYDEDDSDKETREKRRGVHSLGLKSSDSGFQGRGRGRGGRRGGGGRGGGRGRSGRGGGGRGGGGRGGGRGRH